MALGLVVGGGPAGLSAALGLRRSGWEATLLEQQDRWGGRVCGEFLDSEALSHLAWLGLLDRAREKGSEISHIRIGTGRDREARVALPTPTLTLSRHDLEDILLSSAQKNGVVVRTGVRVTDRILRQRKWQIPLRTGEEVSSDILILAAGRFADGNTPDQGQNQGWYGWSADFNGLHQDPRELTMFFYQGGYVGGVVFPNGAGHICGLVRRDEVSLNWENIFQLARTLCPGFARLTCEAVRKTPWRGVGPLPFGVRRSGKEIRVGDAAAVGDPFMGEGIGRALAAGRMLHAAIQVTGGTDVDLLAGYNKIWRQAYRPRQWLGYALRTLLNQDRIADFVINVLISRPNRIAHLIPFFHGGFTG